MKDADLVRIRHKNQLISEPSEVLNFTVIGCHQGLYSLSGKTSYHQISWSLEAARLGVVMIASLWNLTGILAALVPRCLLNFRAIRKIRTRISRHWDFTRSCGKTSYPLVNRGPGGVLTSELEMIVSMFVCIFVLVCFSFLMGVKRADDVFKKCTRGEFH